MRKDLALLKEKKNFLAHLVNEFLSKIAFKRLIWKNYLEYVYYKYASSYSA